MLLHLVSSFLHTRSLAIQCVFVSVYLIDCTLLSSLSLSVILLIFSLNTLCFSLLNLCSDININFFFFFMNSLSLLHRPAYFVFSTRFISFPSWVAGKQCLESSNLSFRFMKHFFWALCFFIFHHYHLLNSYMFLISMRLIFT